MQKINLIMPMGGMGSRFAKYGYNYPKPLIEIYEKPFFFWATRSIEKFVNLEKLIFVVLQSHIDDFQIDKKIYEFFPKAKIKVIPQVLNGAVLTCMEGVSLIDNDYPIVFNDCDHLFKSTAFNDYCNRSEKNIDGACLTFKSNENKFSFVKYGADGQVIGTKEKEVVSNDAICGAYYFKNKKVFLDGCDDYLKKCDYNEFYVSGIYNVLIDKDKKIETFDTDYHVAFGTPEEFIQAKLSEKYRELL